MIMHIVLSLAWIMQLATDLFTVLGEGISGRDLILLLGGGFLMWRAVHEVHNTLEGVAEDEHGGKTATYASVLAQIALVDFHTPKGYIYFAMAFAVGVEILNLKAGERSVSGKHPVISLRSLLTELIAVPVECLEFLERRDPFPHEIAGHQSTRFLSGE